ncbi:MAG: hypothetical protein HY901_18805 [Deltaproteobacteria bacterium]|nr:hypothetical protein [Deltaproteobacteria bacterium]
MRLELEPRLLHSRAALVGISIGSVAVGLLAGAVVLAATGIDPLEAYGAILQASLLGGGYAISDTLVKATPLLLCGLGCAVAFKARLWNVGAEGQLLLGAWAATGVASSWLPPQTPAPLMLLAMGLAACVAGALWAGIAGWLKAWMGVNEVITSLMLVYVAQRFLAFFVFGAWSEGGFPLTPVFPRSGWLPRLSDLAGRFPALSGITLHLGLVVALLACVVMWLAMTRSVWGFEIRLLGDSPKAAAYAGLPVQRRVLMTMLVAGALAGLRLHRHRGGVAWASASDGGLGFVGGVRGAAGGCEGGAAGGHRPDAARSGDGDGRRGRFPGALPDSNESGSFTGVAMTPEAFTFLENLLAAGVARGTPILLAAVGELLAERSGVLNLGVEGMMLLGAAVGYSVAWATGSLVLGLLAAMAAAAALAAIHGLVAVSLGGDQVVSGLGVGFFGAGLAAVVGADLVGVSGVPRAPTFELEGFASLPILGPTLFSQNVLVYVGLALAALTWVYLYRTRWGLKLRAVGESPTAADAQGIHVGLVRHLHVAAGGALAGLGGASLSLAVTPGWVDGMTSGIGWIAVGLVIFGAWDPVRVAIGAYLFGAIRRLPLDLQGIEGLPFLRNPNLGYFLDMLPYLFTIAVLAVASRGSWRQRFSTPAALGTAFVRGERGR